MSEQYNTHAVAQPNKRVSLSADQGKANKTVLRMVTVFLLLILAAGVFYGIKSYGNYHWTADSTVKGYKGEMSYSLAVPYKLRASGENSYSYEKGDSIVSAVLFSQTAAGDGNTIDGFLVPYLTGRKVSNHTITGEITFGYKYGVDSFEKITINDKKGVLTRTDYQYEVAPGASIELAVMSIATECGNKQTCSIWVATSDPGWSDPRQSLIDMATSLKEK